MNFTSKGPAEAKSTIALRRILLIRRPYAWRRGRRETIFECHCFFFILFSGNQQVPGLATDSVHLSIKWALSRQVIHVVS